MPFRALADGVGVAEGHTGLTLLEEPNHLRGAPSAELHAEAPPGDQPRRSPRGDGTLACQPGSSALHLGEVG